MSSGPKNHLKTKIYQNDTAISDPNDFQKDLFMYNLFITIIIFHAPSKYTFLSRAIHTQFNDEFAL